MTERYLHIAAKDVRIGDYIPTRHAYHPHAFPVTSISTDERGYLTFTSETLKGSPTLFPGNHPEQGVTILRWENNNG